MREIVNLKDLIPFETLTMGLGVIKDVYRRKAEERERVRRGFIENVFSALEKLSKEVSFEEAYIFGSIANPYQFGESSDVDIAFKGLDRDRLFFTISFLDRELEREVNVVPIEDVHFRDKIIREGIKWKKD